MNSVTMHETHAVATQRGAGVPIMTLTGIRKAFGPVQALSGVDLVVNPGEIHAIVGENGAGKSTLIAIAAGVLSADEGAIELAGERILSPRVAALRQAGVAVAFQHPALAPDLTVLENLQLVAPQLDGAAGRAEAEALLGSVATDELRMPLDRRCAELSLAQLHIVEIVRVLAIRPRVVFFDEPTEPFQQTEVRKLFGLIRSLRDQGIGIIYVSHRLAEVKELADRISVIRDGQIIDSRLAHAISDAEIVTLIAGRPLGQVFPEKAKSVGAPVLEAAGLGGPGFHQVDFVARAGEIVGLAGVEGEGQREFIRALAGIGTHVRGSLSVGGKVQQGLHLAAALRAAGVGFVPDDRHAEGLFLSLSVRENLAIGSLDQRLENGLIDQPAEAAMSGEMVERLRVKAPSVETLLSNLSGGNQQKVIIGREMVAKPVVLLVDEPTKGVDVGARSEIYHRLRTLADEGLAVVVCSSDGIELEGMCDRVLIFARGQVVRELTGADVTDAKITEANLTATVSRMAEGTAVSGMPMVQAGTRNERWRELLASDHAPAAILAVLTAIVVGGTAIINPFFISGFNVETMLAFLAIVAFVAIAQLVTILVGAIDLSVGALAGLVVVLASYLTPDGAGGLQIFGGVILILLIATAFGLLQGWLVTAVGIPAIVVTLATFVGLQGVSLALRPQADGQIADALSAIPQFPLAGIPLGMILALIVVGVFEWVLYRHPLGRSLRAIGSSPLAAGRLGIDRDRLLLFAFALAGLLTGVGGLMLAGQVGIGSAATGTDYTLMSITAVVLGGASIGGGRGSVICTLMGAALVQAISSASSFINSDSSVHYAVLGLVTLLAAVFFSVARLRRGAAHG